MNTETTTIVIELPDLRSRIKAEDSKARSIAKKSLDHVIECGRLLIELKARVNHGHWKYEARQLNMSARTISNYMRIAANRQQVAVLGEGVRDALELLSIAKSPPPAQVEQSPPPLSRPPSRPAVIEVEAEIVEPVAPTTAPAVATPTAAPAKAVFTSPAKPPQVMAILVFEIHKTLPRLSHAELEEAQILLTELVTIINTRWLPHPAPAPVDHLAACWKSAPPEDRAAFLETCHLIEAP